jgi:hypothetical protein
MPWNNLRQLSPAASESRRKAVVDKYSFAEATLPVAFDSFELTPPRFSLRRYCGRLKRLAPYVIGPTIAAILAAGLSILWVTRSLNTEIVVVQSHSAMLQGRLDALTSQLKQQHQNVQSQNTVVLQNSSLLAQIQNLTTQLRNHQSINQQQQYTIQALVAQRSVEKNNSVR